MMITEVDASGLICPLPILKLKKHLMQLPSGALLRLITTDNASAADIPYFCEVTSAVLLETSEEAGKHIFLIRKK